MNESQTGPGSLTRSSIHHRGYRLSYLDSYPDDPRKPVILLLHGFPDSAAMWEKCVEPLSRAGYRCIAPDTIGCGESEMARKVSDYRMQDVTSDFLHLMDELQVKRFILVGHDWGAVLAWYLSIHYPERVQRLVAVSVGHPTAYARDGIRQKLRGWYTLFFQLRGIAERLLLADGPTGLARLISRHPDTTEVMQRLREPGRMSAAIGLYRANLKDLLLKTYAPAQGPVLCIWSEQDAYLTETQASGSAAYVDGEFRFEKLGGGHWIPLDQPEPLSELILNFAGPATSA